MLLRRHEFPTCQQRKGVDIAEPYNVLRQPCQRAWQGDWPIKITLEWARYVNRLYMKDSFRKRDIFPHWQLAWFLIFIVVSVSSNIIEKLNCLITFSKFKLYANKSGYNNSRPKTQQTLNTSNIFANISQYWQWYFKTKIFLYFLVGKCLLFPFFPIFYYNGQVGSLVGFIYCM